MPTMLGCSANRATSPAERFNPPVRPGLFVEEHGQTRRFGDGNKVVVQLILGGIDEVGGQDLHGVYPCLLCYLIESNDLARGDGSCPGVNRYPTGCFFDDNLEDSPLFRRSEGVV